MNVVDPPIDRTPATCIVAALIAISKKTRTVLALRLAELGLTIGEDDVLIAMTGRNAISVTDLSRTLSTRFSTMIGIIDGLVERGHIDRIAGPVVALSDDGAALVPRVEGIRAHIAAELAADLGRGMLDQIAENLEAIDASLGKTIAPKI